ncbi:MAG: GldG family protein [bacterium]
MNRILKICLPVLLLISLLWFIFLPQYYRFGYALLILSGLTLLSLAFYNREIITTLIKRKNNIKSANAILTVLLVVIIAAAINYIAYRNDRSVDLTRAKINTLSDETVKVLKNLKTDVHFIAFLDPAAEGASFKYAMDKYAHYTNKLSYEIVDPNKELVKAKSYDVTRYGTIIASSGENETRMESLTEEGLTNSIIKLTRKGKKKIYFLSGHGERDVDSEENTDYSSLKKIISGQNYTVEKLDLLTSRVVPQDASLLVIAGPKKAFFEKEVSVIENYIKANGPVFILSDPSSPNSMIKPDQNVNKVLASFNVRLRDDIVIDPESKLFGVTEAMPVVQSYDPVNPITAGFREVTIYPFAQSIDVSKADRKRYNITELCRTTNTSWGEVGAKSGTIKFDKDRDIKGPLDICVLINDKFDRDIVVFGNASFVSNQYISHAANSDIFMNAVSYLVKDGDLISIRPKMEKAGNFQMPGGLLVGLFTVYVLPFSILGGGIVYWYRRRKK